MSGSRFWTTYQSNKKARDKRERSASCRLVLELSRFEPHTISKIAFLCQLINLKSSNILSICILGCCCTIAICRQRYKLFFIPSLYQRNYFLNQGFHLRKESHNIFFCGIYKIVIVAALAKCKHLPKQVPLFLGQ